MKKYQTLNSGATYKSRHRVTNNLFFADHISGPGRAPGMCVYESGPGAQPRFQSWGPIPWSRLLYRTKYGWYTQFRALQCVT